MTSHGAESRHSQVAWVVAVPGMYAWIKVMPAGRGLFPTEQAAKDALAQMGPIDGKVMKGETRYG